MGKKKTTEQYVGQMLVLHNEYYTYPRTVYVRSGDKVIVTCPVHGDFTIGAGKHQQGQGCRDCANDRNAENYRDSKETFIKKSEPRHKDKYDYSLVVMVNDFTKVKIICREHGVFSQTPNEHKHGSGCPDCATWIRRGKSPKPIKDYFAGWERKYDNKYDYSLADLNARADEVIEIVCPHHGSFWSTAQNHNIRGCAKCAEYGFNSGNSATFYILTDGFITKVGITNRDVVERVKKIRKSSKLDFKVHTTIFSEDGAKIQEIERETLAWLRSKYKGVATKFDGYTECFVDVCLKDLLDFVIPLS